jgi:hypothetical protein
MAAQLNTDKSSSHAEEIEDTPGNGEYSAAILARSLRREPALRRKGSGIAQIV